MIFSNCCVIATSLYEVSPYELPSAARNATIASKAKKLQASAMVAAGYGGDMDRDKVNDILDDMDFDYNNNVCCHLIERMIPQLNKMVEREMLY